MSITSPVKLKDDPLGEGRRGRVGGRGKDLAVGVVRALMQGGLRYSGGAKGIKSLQGGSDPALLSIILARVLRPPRAPRAPRPAEGIGMPK